MTWGLINADVIEGLRRLPDASVHCVVTSPPYLWQRDYQCEGQIGKENSIEEYILRLMGVFAEVRRVLRPDGTLWVNIGDGYANDTKWGGRSGNRNTNSDLGGYQRARRKSGIPSKSLMAIPARFQVAMIDAGWICRNEIIWHKPTSRPECVQDRCSRDHEQVFLFSKSPKYYYDPEAVKQPASPKTVTVKTSPVKGDGNGSAGDRLNVYQDRNGRYYVEERNLRTVWSIPAEPSDELHYAAFPSALPELCIQAGTSEKGCCAKCGGPWVRVIERRDTGRRQKMADSWETGSGRHGSFHRSGREKGKTGVPVMVNVTTGWRPSCKCEDAGDPVDCVVLDPFAGKSTTGGVALRLGRRFIGIELSSEYCQMSERRLREAERQAYGDLFLPLQEAAHPTLF
jgi:DNA modification methylase